MTKRSKPFWMYVKVYRELWQKNGRDISLEDAKREAAALWSEIGSREKQMYHELAKKETVRRRLKSWSFHDWHNDNEYTADRQRSMFRHVRKVTDVAERSAEGLLKYRFFLIDVNLQLDEPESTDKVRSDTFEYRPCELSVVSCTIENGLENRYHVHLHPGNPSPDKLDETLRFSRETHGIPPSGLPQSIRSMIAARYRLRQFARDCAFFAASQNMSNVSGALNFINKHCNRSDPIVVLDANVLLSTLLNLNVSKSRRTTMPQVNDYVESRQFENHLHQSCLFHNEIGRENQCSFLRVSSLAYRFCNVLAAHFGVDLVEGHHYLSSPEVPRKLNLESGCLTNRNILNRWHSDSHLVNCEAQQTQGCCRSLSEKRLVSADLEVNSVYLSKNDSLNKSCNMYSVASPESDFASSSVDMLDDLYHKNRRTTSHDIRRDSPDELISMRTNETSADESSSFSLTDIEVIGLDEVEDLEHDERTEKDDFECDLLVLKDTSHEDVEILETTIPAGFEPGEPSAPEGDL